MILGIGNDVLDVGRMERELGLPDGGIREQIFTPGEIAECEGRPGRARHYAARFAAKEAVVKALGSGREDGLAWQEVEILSGPAGEDRVALHGKVGELARRLEVKRVVLSLSHTGDLATAWVVLEG